MEPWVPLYFFACCVVGEEGLKELFELFGLNRKVLVFVQVSFEEGLKDSCNTNFM